jgi:alginate O-acetyltransferase complex protein AlgI
MLFNSLEFLFAFLPVVFVVFSLLDRIAPAGATIGWLVGASLVFYGWWNPAYLVLIIGSTGFNYAMARLLARRRSRGLMWMGVGIDLLSIAYFKYAGFMLENLNAVSGANWDIGQILLPLGISFFTFQQISYLVDVYRGDEPEKDFLHYALFVTFFPQLIAGPIVHHSEILPQFRRFAGRGPLNRRLTIGMTIFFVGLFKKVVIADGLAFWASPVFAAADSGLSVGALEAWCGTFAYTFQLYFDFSGYSDMAIGLGALFGIRLPINFNSPYRSHSMIEFWRGWHMTLSRFLRDYVYIPLGGNRKGPNLRYLNLMLTMLIGGLWHGAGWNFLLWGGMHGVFLVANHLFRAWRGGPGAAEPVYRNAMAKHLCWAITLLAVAIAWVPFRAETSEGAAAILQALVGVSGFSVNDSTLYFGLREVFTLLGLTAFVRVLPNIFELMREYGPEIPTGEDQVHGSRLKWQPQIGWALATGVIAALSLMSLFRPSEFLYFQF